MAAQAGYDEVYIGQVGGGHEGFFEFYADAVLPRLRERQPNVVQVMTPAAGVDTGGLQAALRARQRALASWQSSETDTEQLSIALREYRRFGAQVRQMGPEEPTRPSAAAG